MAIHFKTQKERLDYLKGSFTEIIPVEVKASKKETHNAEKDEKSSKKASKSKKTAKEEKKDAKVQTK